MEIKSTSSIPTRVWATLIVAAVSIFILAIVREQINERFKAKMFMPVPIDVIVVRNKLSFYLINKITKKIN